MNFIDIILIIVIVALTFAALILDFICVQDEGFSSSLIGIFVLWMVAVGVTSLPFLVVDKHSGMTKGYVTSVDENFFGTTAIFIKTSETAQEEYCIEDSDLSEIAYGVIGKEVVIKYGKRVGLYSTGRCSQAPVEYIGVVDETEKTE